MTPNTRLAARAVALLSFFGLLALAVVQAQGCDREAIEVETIDDLAPSETASEPAANEVAVPDAPAEDPEPSAETAVTPPSNVAPAAGADDPMFLPASKSGGFLIGDDAPQAVPQQQAAP